MTGTVFSYKHLNSPNTKRNILFRMKKNSIFSFYNFVLVEAFFLKMKF